MTSVLAREQASLASVSTGAHVCCTARVCSARIGAMVGNAEAIRSFRFPSNTGLAACGSLEMGGRRSLMRKMSAFGRV